jgi:hypothetical protein
MRLEGLGQLKKSNYLIGTRTRDLSTNYATACPLLMQNFCMIFKVLTDLCFVGFDAVEFGA